MKNDVIYIAFILALLGIVLYLANGLSKCGKELTACGKLGVEATCTDCANE